MSLETKGSTLLYKPSFKILQAKSLWPEIKVETED